jgi:hemoglobin
MKTDIRDDEDIRVFVYAFYDKVRQHERLGHIFNEVAQVDWDSHLPRMVDFWSNLIFRTGRFSGQPFRKHLPLPIVFQDFGSWLGLFHETIDEHFVGPTAEFTKNTAGNIANSFAIRMEIEREKQTQ